MVAVDIGNSGIKLGTFKLETVTNRARGELLPEPESTLHLSIENKTGDFETRALAHWCEAHTAPRTCWRIASVNRRACEHFVSTIAEWAEGSSGNWPILRITHRDITIPIRVDEPDRVGIDRLLAALAANRLQSPDRAAIIVDLGTAITVDLLEADGAFAGGAILPGIATSARALDEQTDALPRVAMEFLDKPPAPLGKSTVPAIESGIYWGAIGSIRELIAQLSAPLAAPPDVFVTGGASANVVDLLAKQYPVRHVPHLVLSGIAVAGP